MNNINLFNDIQSKSLILYYYHDLENRTSFLYNEEFYKDYIKYENDNVDITKGNILKNVKIISDGLVDVYLSHLQSSKEFQKFFMFLYYLDKENFVDFFTLLILAYLDYSNVKITNFSNSQINDSFHENLTRIKNDPVIQKEIKIIKECLNLRTPFKSLCKN